METKNFNEVATSVVAKSAKTQVKRINPFYYINELNNLAKKNEYLDNLPLKELQSRCKELHNGKKGFDPVLFTRDYANRFCTVRKYNGAIEFCDAYKYDNGTIANENGYELIINSTEDGFLLLQPVTLSLNGFLTAFQFVITQKEKLEREQAKEAKAKAKEEEQVAKEKDAKIAKLAKEFSRGVISFEEFQARVRAIDLGTVA